MSTDGDLKGGKERITKAAGAFGLATLFSRILGFARDMIIADFFGAKASADAFFVAFRIPNLLRRLTAEGAMTAAFIPVFTSVKSKEGILQAFRLTSNVLSIMAVILAIVVSTGVIFADYIVWAIAPGFTGDADLFELTTLLTRIMIPYLLLISLAAILMGTLNAMGTFFLPALAPAFLNIAIIICAIAFHDTFDEPAMSLAIGVMAGGVLQLLIQLPPMLKKGFRYVPSFNIKDPATKKVGLLLIPGAMGMAVAEVNIFVDTLLASLLPEGSVSYLYYGNRITQFPLGIFGVAIGVAALPSMSSAVVEGGKEKLVELLSHSLRLTLFISIPATAGLLAAAGPIANVLFERGAFNEVARDGTVIAIIFYAIGLAAFSGVKAVVAAFYALHNTSTPMRVAAWSMVINVVLNILLMGPLLHGGLALATSISSTINLFALLYIFRREAGQIDGSRILRSSLPMFASSCVMGFLVWLYSSFVFSYDASTFLRSIHIGAIVALGVLVYFALMLLFRSEEAIGAKNRIAKKLKGSTS